MMIIMIHRFYQWTTKSVECEGDGYVICNWRAWNCPRMMGKETGSDGNRRTSKERLNYSIDEIDQNTKKSLGDLRWLAATQTLVKDHKQILVGKTGKAYKYNK